MTWFKVDDRMTAHPVVGKVGDAGLGYWMRLGCWLAQFPAQGDYIPKAVAIHLLYGGRRKRLHDLIAAGMLIESGDGYVMYGRLNIAGSGLRDRSWKVEIPGDSRPHIPDLLRQAVYDRDGRACLRCGATDNLSLDHVYPFSMGGPDTFDNLQTLCTPCNSSKGVMVT